MFAKLPYRIQIPLGLSVAVVIAALLVTAVSARISARVARENTLATVDRAVALLNAQARPLLAAEDTWRVFALLRNTAELLPSAQAGHSRAAVLDAEGRVFAGSEPRRLETGRRLLGDSLPAASAITVRRLVADAEGDLILIDPIRSEDGQRQGFVYVEVDSPAFAPDWGASSKPALIGALMAVSLLVPVGWWTGRRMTQPVADIAQLIDRIGREPPALVKSLVPRTADPELGRISEAVDRLIGEMQVRQQAEQRAISTERMAALGRLTAAIAHEINNPLGGLLNATQTLRLHGGSEAVRLRTIDLIERGLQQIRTTVAAVLPHARIEDRPLEVNDLADVATLVLPMADRFGIELRSHANLSAPARVPSAAVRQVMLNMLTNAVKAAGENGWVQALLTGDSEVVRFCVSNSGERFDAANLERTIAREGGNDPHGFGLWVCREIASQFGGGFTVVEAEHGAATQLMFWIRNRERHEIAAAD